MDVLDFIALLVIFAAFFLIINVKYLKLHSTIGLMLLALGLSLLIIFGEMVFSALRGIAENLMTEYDFSDVLLKVMLSFLLFAGALEMDLSKLGEEKWPILILATVGTLMSTFIVGTAIYYVLPLVNLPLDYLFCLLFGALISPTDPIAVLAMVKQTRISKNLESQIAGESLFNDGVGVVVFLTILTIALPESGEAHIDPLHIAELFGIEVIGGLAFGSLIGYIGLRLLIMIPNEYTEIEVLVTLSMVLGGASMAEFLGVSGPLSMVAMGLFVGNKGRSAELEEAAGEYVYKFWHLMDESMNAILFILIGLQIIVINWQLDFFLAAAFAIVIVLISRLISIGVPIFILRFFRTFPKWTVRILTWAGLRGGIAVALALSLYHKIEGTDVDFNNIDIIIAMTYCVVLFSIVVQGITIGKLFKKVALPEDSQSSEPTEPAAPSESSESSEPSESTE